MNKDLMKKIGLKIDVAKHGLINSQKKQQSKEAQISADEMKDQVKKLEDYGEFLSDISAKAEKQVHSSAVNIEHGRALADSFKEHGEKFKQSLNTSSLGYLLIKVRDCSIITEDLKTKYDTIRQEKFFNSFKNLLEDEVNNAKMMRKKFDRLRSQYNNASNKVKQTNAKETVNFMKLQDAEQERDSIYQELEQSKLETLSTLYWTNERTRFVTMDRLCSYIESLYQFFEEGFQAFSAIMPEIQDHHSNILKKMHELDETPTKIGFRCGAVGGEPAKKARTPLQTSLMDHSHSTSMERASSPLGQAPLPLSSMSIGTTLEANSLMSSAAPQLNNFYAPKLHSTEPTRRISRSVVLLPVTKPLSRHPTPIPVHALNSNPSTPVQTNPLVRSLDDPYSSNEEETMLDESNEVPLFTSSSPSLGTDNYVVKSPPPVPFRRPNANFLSRKPPLLSLNTSDTKPTFEESSDQSLGSPGHSPAPFFPDFPSADEEVYSSSILLFKAHKVYKNRGKRKKYLEVDLAKGIMIVFDRGNRTSEPHHLQERLLHDPHHPVILTQSYFTSSLRHSVKDKLKTGKLKKKEESYKVYTSSNLLQLILSEKYPKRVRLLVADNDQQTFTFKSRVLRERFHEAVWSLQSRLTLPYLIGDDLHIFIGSWNVGERPPPERNTNQNGLSAWLPKNEFYDIIAIGLQECEYVPRKGNATPEIDFFNTLQEELGPKYIKIAGVSLVAIRLIVFVRRDHCYKISQLKKSTEATGIAHVMGNKGGVGISFSFLNTKLCFISCHLAAHQEKHELRNSNYTDILKGLKLGDGPFNATYSFHHVFWFGDLNYRIDLSRDQVLDLVQAKNWSALLNADQLTREKANGNCFFSFQEGNISFPPTYRYKIGSRQYDDEKMRIPAWCDRILWSSLPLSNADLTSYASCDEITTRFFFFSKNYPHIFFQKKNVVERSVKRSLA
eukprot:TRINITY_DN2956_c0_g1_i1.p1 TRINITY_DN2956_c0_g1~~TRINITY_DN2956_c0_g1_i1.p1  ORF type:complete len:952 (-),score=192.20 TRINITY_DN2956_c0_g1_i1:966-3821(-)